MKAFILCASPTFCRNPEQTVEAFWTKLPRALVPLGDGTTVLSRLLKQLLRNGVEDVALVVDYKKELIMKRHSKLQYIISDRYKEVVYSFLQTAPFWGDRNFVTLGDVVYSHAAINTILTVEGSLHVFNNATGDPTHGEGWCYVFDRSIGEQMKNLAEKLHVEGKPVLEGGFWDVCGFGDFATMFHKYTGFGEFHVCAVGCSQEEMKLKNGKPSNIAIDIDAAQSVVIANREIVDAGV